MRSAEKINGLDFIFLCIYISCLHSKDAQGIVLNDQYAHCTKDQKTKRDRRLQEHFISYSWHSMATICMYQLAAHCLIAKKDTHIIIVNVISQVHQHFIYIQILDMDDVHPNIEHTLHTYLASINILFIKKKQRQWNKKDSNAHTHRIKKKGERNKNCIDRPHYYQD